MLPDARIKFCLAAAGGQVYAVGGQVTSSAGHVNVVNTAFEFNRTSRAFDLVAPMAAARESLACVGFADLVFAVGGVGIIAEEDDEDDGEEGGGAFARQEGPDAMASRRRQMPEDALMIEDIE